ncbi:MAG: putative polymerase/3-5 exonuclease [Planctomycetota bacterium]
MGNADIVRLFEEFAVLLELTGANPFRVSAHTKVARAAEASTVDLAGIARTEPASLSAIDGIGASSAAKIVEFVTTGAVKDLDALRAEVPAGLPALLALPGVGPKSVRLLWQERGIVDLASLEAALGEGRLDGLAGFGPKKLQNLRDGIAFLKTAVGRVRIDQARSAADLVIERLRTDGVVSRIEAAGSLRRGKETIGDVDLVALADDPARAMASFCSMPGVAKVLVTGPTKSSVRLEDGLQVDLRIVPVRAFGAALLYFTGSKEHNVLLRGRAQQRGLRLNEYGLFHDDGQDAPQERGEPIASATEEELYGALGLGWAEPELRELLPLEQACGHAPLVTVGDIHAELHAHTDASDGAMPLDELIRRAKDRGFHTIAVTDHSRSSVQANGLSVERLLGQIDAVREAEARIGGIRVLAGSEVDILVDGSLDYPDEVLERLDLVVASPHASLKQAPDVATARLVRAVRHPLVHVLGHPTGRLVNGRPGLEPDMHAVIAAAKESGVALEINAHPARLDLRDLHARMAIEAGVPLAINCDVHGRDGFEVIRYGVQVARRAGAGPAQVVNAWDATRLHAWIAARRGR